MEKGDVIKIRFYTNDAPNTVKRIAELISTGFYNGITVHRVEPGFVVQAGDPTGTGAGGSGQKLKAEFNSHKHEPGVLSMARIPSDPDSADSQFFIMLGISPQLDGQYTTFGKVVDGFPNVLNIQRGDKIKSFTIQ
jgi:cyclophilin family peptidyl-prolyl cis-trans isomerase